MITEMKAAGIPEPGDVVFTDYDDVPVWQSNDTENYDQLLRLKMEDMVLFIAMVDEDFALVLVKNVVGYIHAIRVHKAFE